MNPWDFDSSYSNPLTQGTQGYQQPGAQQQGGQQAIPYTDQMMAAQNQYPAYPNAYGLGGPIDDVPQSQPIPGSPSNPDYMEKPGNVTATDSSSRGFNPWSLMGESNARGS